MIRRLAPLLAAAVVLVPLIRSPESDSYPLSTYPMFATDRGRVAAIATAVAIDSDGVITRLGSAAIGGTDEVILAAATVSAAVGRDEVAELCEEIAHRLDRAEFSTVIVRTEVVDVVSYVADDAAPLSIEEHGRCEVAR